MKLKIQIKCNNDQCMPEVIDKGEWVDLYLPKDVKLKSPYVNYSGKFVFNYTKIDLEICMRLLKGYEAIVAPRSSTFEHHGIICPNSIGVIDNPYNGDNDSWKFPVVPLRNATINAGQRICQFRIQLSQKATVWQRIKDLFCSGIEFERVDSLGNSDRGGFGTTGR